MQSFQISKNTRTQSIFPQTYFFLQIAFPFLRTRIVGQQALNSKCSNKWARDRDEQSFGNGMIFWNKRSTQREQAVNNTLVRRIVECLGYRELRQNRAKHPQIIQCQGRSQGCAMRALRFFEVLPVRQTKIHKIGLLPIN